MIAATKIGAPPAIAIIFFILFIVGSLGISTWEIAYGLQEHSIQSRQLRPRAMKPEGMSAVSSGANSAIVRGTLKTC